MGIDIYASWRGQTPDEQHAQVTGFSVVHGNVGYLREAYHGEPYATRILMPEAFEHEIYPDGAPIAASVLRERLPKALAAAIDRERRVYDAEPLAKETIDVLQSYRDFVALCEAKERETGAPCIINASY